MKGAAVAGALLSLLLASTGCLPSSAGAEPPRPAVRATATGGTGGGSPSARGFVARDSTGFVLDGKPFRFVGANMYNAAGDPRMFECGPHMANPDRELDDWFSRARNEFGGTVIRFWAFQSYTNGGIDWRSLDRVMQTANRHQIRVIPVLENQWRECTRGGYKASSWYSKGYLDGYGGYPASYKEYVRRVVTRYRDERAVFAWMLMNEAESQDASKVADADALYSFTSNMSGFIKSLDPNHMVTLGTIGGKQPGVAGGGYERLHALGTIDFLDAHDYDPENRPMSVDLAEDFAVSRRLDKPLVVGEAGITVDELPNQKRVESLASRAAKFDAKMGAFFGAGGSGYLVWAWHPETSSFHDFTTGDPLNAVLKKRSSSIAGR